MGGYTPDPKNGKTSFKGYWVFFVLIFAVLTLSILAFNSPVSQDSRNTTPSPAALSGDLQTTSTAEVAQTMTAETTLLPPTPEEIGFTNGIILWSTILILILLVGTFREVLYRRQK